MLHKIIRDSRITVSKLKLVTFLPSKIQVLQSHSLIRKNSFSISSPDVVTAFHLLSSLFSGILCVIKQHLFNVRLQHNFLIALSNVVQMLEDIRCIWEINNSAFYMCIVWQHDMQWVLMWLNKWDNSAIRASNLESIWITPVSFPLLCTFHLPWCQLISLMNESIQSCQITEETSPLYF